MRKRHDNPGGGGSGMRLRYQSVDRRVHLPLVATVEALSVAARSTLAQMHVGGIQGDRKLAWIPARLCEEQAALDRRHRCRCECGNVGVSLEFAVRLHRLESGRKRSLPPRK